VFLKWSRHWLVSANKTLESPSSSLSRKRNFGGRVLLDHVLKNVGISLFAATAALPVGGSSSSSATVRHLKFFSQAVENPDKIKQDRKADSGGEITCKQFHAASPGHFRKTCHQTCKLVRYCNMWSLQEGLLEFVTVRKRRVEN
jgi:hypothetical protein